MECFVQRGWDGKTNHSRETILFLNTRSHGAGITQFRCHQHFQNCCGAADCSTNGEQSFRDVRMLLSHQLKPLGNVLKVLSFAQDVL